MVGLVEQVLNYVVSDLPQSNSRTEGASQQQTHHDYVCDHDSLLACDRGSAEVPIHGSVVARQGMNLPRPDSRRAVAPGLR